MKLLNQKCLGLKAQESTQLKSNPMKKIRNHKKEKYLKLHPELALAVIKSVVTKDEWRILLIQGINTNRIYFPSNNPDIFKTYDQVFSCYLTAPSNYKIISIQREDGTQFQIGDRVTCTGGFRNGTIQGFKINKGYPRASEKYLSATIPTLNPLQNIQEPNIACLSHDNS